jgi:hypothetical protein
MNTRVGQWLVLTSWSGMDGTHMVLTTMSLPDVSETPARVLEGDAPSDATGEPDAGQAQSAPQQVRRYAAVPVRGGWLVIQL